MSYTQYKLPEPFIEFGPLGFSSMVSLAAGKYYTEKQVQQAYDAGYNFQAEQQVQQQLDLLSANKDLYQHREILLINLAEIERLRTENLALTQENKDLIKTNLVCQKEFDALLKDYTDLEKDYRNLERELNYVEDQYHYYGRE